MSKQLTQIAITALGAIALYDEVLLFKKTLLINKMANALGEATTLMQQDSETISYLLDILNKHRPEIDDFDMIALANLGINFGPPEPR